MRRGRREQGEGKRNRRREGGWREDEDEGRRMEEGGRMRGEWMTSNAWRAY